MKYYIRLSDGVIVAQEAKSASLALQCAKAKLRNVMLADDANAARVLSKGEVIAAKKTHKLLQ